MLYCEYWLALDTDEKRSLDSKQRETVRETYRQLESQLGYDSDSARECLKFTLQHNKKRRKG